MAPVRLGKSRQEKEVCQNCRERHLRCDGFRPCKQCQGGPAQCKYRPGKLKFRAGSSKRLDAKFHRDQVWLSQTNNELEFLDMTPMLRKYYTDAEPLTVTGVAGTPGSDHGAATSSLPAWQTPPLSEKTQGSPVINSLPSPPSGGHVSGRHSSTAVDYKLGNGHRDRFSFSQQGDVHHADGRSSSDTGAYCATGPRSKTADITLGFPNTSNISMAVNISPIPMRQDGRSPNEFTCAPSAIYGDQFFWPDSHTSTQCICLIRHFIENIGPWFDIYDREHHFSQVIPQRARGCPPLLNAIFTVAAKSLVEMPSYRASDGIVVFDGIQLPDLTAATAIEYHNKCIAYFLEISDQTELIHDENLLAAAIILRYYEFLDTPRGGEVQEQFLKTFQLLVSSQASTAFSPPSSEELYSSSRSPPLSPSIRRKERPKASLLRPVACWMALRLEVTSAFIKQRPIGIPLGPWASQRSFDGSDDNAWAHRLILHCADVLQFCFADEVVVGQTRGERWKELKGFEDMWQFCMPETFSPILYKEPDQSKGQCFPQIWYMSHCHVLGTQYLELSRILQTVYDPTIPRLGIGSIVATCRVSSAVRDIVVRVFGNAISNAHIQSALITAYLAISLADQYITDRREQTSILKSLVKLEVEYAWPTSKTLAELKQIWSYEEDLGDSDEEAESAL